MVPLRERHILKDHDGGVMSMRRGQLEIHPELNEIAGPGGRERIEPQAMTVLELLTREPGRVWPRSELLERGWPGRVVADSTLTGVISRLRRSLQSVGAEDTRIETRSKRGYVLVVTTSNRRPHRVMPAAAASLAMVFLTLVAWGLTRPPSLTSLEGVRLDFEIAGPDREIATPVIWLQEDAAGEIFLDDGEPLHIRIVPRLQADGLIRLAVEARTASHWTGFEQSVGLGTESRFELRSARPGAEYEIRFVASLADPPAYPQEIRR